MHWCIWDGNRSDRIHISYYGGIYPYAFALHGHRGFVELTLVRKGVLEHQLAGTWHQQRKGIATLIREGEAHALRGTKVEYINISFDPAYLGHLEPTVAAAIAQPDIFTVALPSSRLTAIEADCDTLYAAIAAHQHPLRDALLISMLGLLTSQTLLTASTHAGDCPTWLMALQKRLDAEDETPIDLGQLRQLAGVAPEHLSRTVRRCLGYTPTQWLRQRRLNQASRLLAATDLPVGTIATRCGYRSPGLFHRHFSALHGLSPSAYRHREQRFVR
jgi:AraC family transcriptional regulator, dual regulator of chb operon